MFTLFKKSFLTLAGLIIPAVLMVHAQRIISISVNTVVYPPYTVPFGELSENLQLTLLSSASLEGVYITMSITGDNGVLIESNRNQVQRFYIEGGIPLMVPSPDFDISYLFQQQNLNFSNININSLYESGLPPGNYQICFRVWMTSSTSGEIPVSGAAPQGCANFTIQQPVVNVTTIVRPPWDANFLEYYNKVLVTLSSSQAAGVYLHMKLSGNNGIQIATAPGYVPESFISLEAGIPVTLTEEFFYDLFNPDRLVYSGIDPGELQERGLPEGTYRLCFKAYGRNGAPVSSPDPVGCSVPFTIRLLEPPTIISPRCGEIFSDESGKPLLFTWTPSPGAPPLTPYTIRIVEMTDPSSHPGDALQTATTPPFLEETVMGTSFLYGPEQPVLEEGKKYAFQVIAGTEALKIENPFDYDAGKLRFKNMGKSAPCYFQYGEEEQDFNTVAGVTFLAPEPEVEAITPDKNILPYTIVQGKLNYKFKGATVNAQQLITGVSNQVQVQNNPHITTAPAQGTLQLSSVSDFNIVETGPGNLTVSPVAMGYIDPAGSKPLANVSVSLEIRYIVLSGSINGEESPGSLINPGMFLSNSIYEEYFPDDGRVLQTTQTSSDGSFTFGFPNIDTTIGVRKNVEILHGSEISDYGNVDIVKTVRLIVNNDYYCSPDVNFYIKPWESNDYGTLVSYVKSYNLLLHVNSTPSTFYDQGMGSGTPLANVNTRILRSALIPGVPFNEGKSKNKIPPVAGTKKQIADGKTDMNGMVVIPNLVRHDPDNNNDRYYISCQTSETSGNINYKDLEKRYSPIYLKDKKNFPFNSVKEEPAQQSSSGGVISMGLTETYGLDITFNSEFEVQTYEYTVHMYPKLPRIYGQAFVTGMKDIVNLDNTMQDTIKPGLKVLLFSQYKKSERVPESENITGTLSIKNTYTDANGRYSFEKLPLELDVSGWVQGSPETYKAKVVGPERWLITKPYGFGLINKDVGTPKYGDQVEANLMLQPDGVVMGYVVDEDGNPVPSSVKIENYPAVKTGEISLGTIMFLSGIKASGRNDLPPGAQVFVFLAPSSESEKLTIIPGDLSTFSPLDTMVRVVKKNSNEPGEIAKYVMKKKMHRARFRIQGYSSPPGKIQMPPKPLKGVKVKINNIIQDVEGITDDNGFVTLQFMHSNTEFLLDITPGEDSEYPVTQRSFTSIPSTEIKNKPDINLYPGYKISGRVSIGPENDFAEDVKVYVDGNPDIVTYTDEIGEFILSRIPPEFKSVIIKAEKQDPEVTIIGDMTNQLNLPHSEPVILHLDIIPELPSSLFGYKIAINSARMEGNSATISGSLSDLSQLKTPNFRLKNPDQVQLDFSEVKLVRSGSEFVPEGSSIPIDAAKINLVINNVFSGEQYPVSGSLITINKSQMTGGNIPGKVKLNNSFGFNSNLFSFKEDCWLRNSGSSDNKMIVFTNGIQLTAGNKYYLSGTNNENIQVMLKGFDGVVRNNKSYLSNDTIVLSLSLTTKEIEKINPSKITINLDELRLTNNGLESLQGNQEISFNLEKWKINSSDWKLRQQSAGFEFAFGVLKTGILDLPVNNIEITPGNIQIHHVGLKDMSLAGVAPINLKTDNCSFGYFPSIGEDLKGHWRLSVVGLSGQPAATVSGLPGMKPGSELTFGTVSILSNGEQSLDFIPSAEDLVFYNTLRVKPIAIYPYDGYFLLSGSMDLGIPRVEKQNGNIRYSRSGNEIKFDLYPLNVDFEGPGKVRFYSSQQFGDQKFESGSFVAPGLIRDEEGIKLYGTLHRTLNETWLKVDPANQVLPIGSNGTTRLIDVKGEMRVKNQASDWGLFSFEGIMDGVKGMEGDKKKKFTIYGDIVATNQNVKVKNIDSGFGNLNITFDYANARMIGDMDINQNFSGLALHGVANMLVDGNGWYFLAGGEAAFPGLGEIQAGFMIGDYVTMPSSVTGRLMQFAYDKHIPSSFSNHISGMFITGRMDVPVIDIPDVNIDLWVVSAKLGIDMGLDARLWMGFEDEENDYGIGAMAFTHAYFISSSISCTNLYADARVEMGTKGIYSTYNGSFTAKGCGSFSLGAKVEQCIPLKLGGCHGCISKSLSKSIKMEMLLDSQGNKDVSYDFGNCSGQSSMSSGW